LAAQQLSLSPSPFSQADPSRPKPKPKAQAEPACPALSSFHLVPPELAHVASPTAYVAGGPKPTSFSLLLPCSRRSTSVGVTPATTSVATTRSQATPSTPWASFLLPAPRHPISPPLVLANRHTDAHGGALYYGEMVVTFRGDSGDNISFYVVATTSRTRPRG
jgi:hypothetical protein